MKKVLAVAISSELAGAGLMMIVVSPAREAAAAPVPAPTGQPTWAVPTSVAPVPPAGFDPLQATAAQLAAYGFPPRPTEPDALALWSSAMAAARYYDPPDPQASSVVHSPPTAMTTGADPGAGAVGDASTVHTNFSTNWAGYSTPAGTNGVANWTSVTAEWVQPAAPADGSYPAGSPSAPDASFWAGIGGINTGNLVQAGADSIGSSPTSYRFWTEDYPQGTVWEGPTIGPGQQAYVVVSYAGGHATYFLENMANGHYSAFQNPAPYYDGTTAEFINERLGAYLPHFGSTQFTACYAGASSWKGLASTSGNTKWVIRNGSGTWISAPTGINKTTNGFTENAY